MFFYYNNKKGAGIFSGISILIGLLFLLLPGITTSLITSIIGGFFLIQGVGASISYFLSLKNGTASIFGVISAFILIALGVFTLTNHETIMSIIPFIVGIFVLFSGINGIQKSFALKNFGDKNWSSSLISAVLKLILALILLMNPFTTAIVTIRVIGLSLLVESVSSYFVARKYKKFMEDNINIMDNIVIKKDFQTKSNNSIDVDFKDID